MTYGSVIAVDFVPVQLINQLIFWTKRTDLRKDRRRKSMAACMKGAVFSCK